MDSYTHPRMLISPLTSPTPLFLCFLNLLSNHLISALLCVYTPDVPGQQTLTLSSRVHAAESSPQLLSLNTASRGQFSTPFQYQQEGWGQSLPLRICRNKRE